MGTGIILFINKFTFCRLQEENNDTVSRVLDKTPENRKPNKQMSLPVMKEQLLIVGPMINIHGLSEKNQDILRQIS